MSPPADGAPPPEVPADGAPPPEVAVAAQSLFGSRLPLAQQYARLLTTDGVVRGLVGPREAPRIWDRHLLNSAVVSELVPAHASVIDVGSGAGLPGIALALARPDVAVVLVESMARRTTFLDEVVAALGLGDRIGVVRARAEDCPGQLAPADAVLARAVGRLDRLAHWCLPLTTVGGRVLAFKGAAVADEIAAHGATVRRFGGTAPVIRRCGVDLLAQPATVVEIVRERDGSRRRMKAT